MLNKFNYKRELILMNVMSLHVFNTVETDKKNTACVDVGLRHVAHAHTIPEPPTYEKFRVTP